MITFEKIVELKDQALSDEDHRPEWLKQLPGAMDPREPYYKFLWLLAASVRPRYSVEIGTRGGTGAFHLADGHKDGLVDTIDIQDVTNNMIEIMRDNCVTNVSALTGDSSQSRHLFTGAIDILFIDGNHTYASSYGDYLAYRPLVVDGGIIVFDDTRLSSDMSSAWNRIADVKLELPELHYMGFGVAAKTPGASILSL